MAGSSTDSCPSCQKTLPDGAHYCPWCGASAVPGGKSAAPRRVVITGIGTISSLGNSTAETWENLVAGKCGLRLIPDLVERGFDCQVRGDIDRETVPNRFLDPKTARNTSPFSKWMVEAAGEALLDAGLLDADFAPTADLSAGGAVIGSCVGGAYEDLIPAWDGFQERGPRSIPPHLHVKYPANLAGYTVQWRFGLGGPSNTVGTACATGTQAIGEAFEQVRCGHAPIMIGGAVEVTSHEMGVAGFMAMKALATDRNDHPEQAARPFDATRAGFILGEGAGAVVLEDLEHARARGAAIYGEVLGYASTNDVYHPIAPHPEGEGAARAIRAALAEGNVDPDRVGFIQAHAASTPAGDLSESKAIRAVYGERGTTIPVSSFKGAIGHCMGGAGAIETTMAICALASQTIPPTLNYANPDPEIGLDIVHGEARKTAFSVFAKHGFGLGGQNAALVIGVGPDDLPKHAVPTRG